ncbi:MAG: hypothetical protein IJ892_00250, partial [Prevotella sp.]|nr:hypothetical protein [Prevotella sp.]
AKVIILATDMDDELLVDGEGDEMEDERYDHLIGQLYHPLKKDVDDANAPEPQFNVVAAEEPEPAEPEAPAKQEDAISADTPTAATPRPATTLGRWKSWLGKKIGDIINDDY